MWYFLISGSLIICLWHPVSAKNFTTTNANSSSSPPFSSTSIPLRSTTTPLYTESQNGAVNPDVPATYSVTMCTQRNLSCGECVKDIKCFWCDADNTCQKYPASKVIPRDCKNNKWYWKQCIAAGHILIYVVPSVCFVVLLVLGCCIYCLCCRNRCSRRHESEDKRFERRREEAHRRNADRRAERRLRTDAIRQKYGLLQDDDDDAEVA